MSISNELMATGRAWLRRFYSDAEVQELATLTRTGDRPGKRLDLSHQLDQLIGKTSRLGKAIRELGVDAAPVRLIAFNKSVDSNWSVPWHQDSVLAVRQRVDVDGYGKWTNKQNFWHCEGPEFLLSKMIFLRVHIDPQTEQNGAMELALRSHRKGFIPADGARVLANACEIEACFADPGDVLIVHALTLHRSGLADMPKARRALRVDYGPRDLLDRRLEWAI